MGKKEQNPFKSLSGIRVIYPVIIGLGVIAFYFYKTDFDPKAFDLITFSARTSLFLLLAILFMVMRDIGYMMRIRILTHNDLNWAQSFRVIMLWEFTSALMPSAVGGTTVAMIYVNKEGINLGRSTAVVMATSFLDEIYFITMFPLLLLTIKVQNLFNVGVYNEFLWFAVIGYAVKFIYTVVLSYGLFINPRGLKWLLLGVFKLPILRKFRYAAHTTGTDIITSSRELRRQKFTFWLKAFGATFFSWSSRYFVANALIMAFFSVSDQFLLFARQLVMQNMLLLTPTPGGSGVAEAIFVQYLGDFIPVNLALAGSITVVLALLWRLVSYYPYLIIGTAILPSWLRKNFKKKQ